MNDQNDKLIPNDPETSNTYNTPGSDNQSPYSPYQNNGYQQQNYNDQQNYGYQQGTGYQQTFDNQAYSPNGYGAYNNMENSNMVKPKKSRKWMWGFSAIPALAIVAVLCFFFIPSFQNFVYKKMLGTTKYYEHVESSCTEQIKDKILSLPKGKKLNPKNGITVNGKVALTLDSSLSEQVGMDLSGFTFDINGSSKDKKSTASYVISYKGTELGTVELCSDPANDQMYLRVPTLSDQYVDYSAFLEAYTAAYSSLMPSDLSPNMIDSSAELLASSSTTLQSQDTQSLIQKFAAELDSETISQLSTEYIKYILDDMGDKGAIKLAENETYQVGSISKKCDEFIITLTPKQFLEVMTNVLNKAKDDEKLLKIMQNVFGDTSSYTKKIDTLINEMEKDETPSDGSSYFRMKVYTDGNQIFGRQFSVTEKGTCVAIIDYGMLTTDDTTTFNASITPEDATEQVSFTIEAKKDGDKSKGTLQLSTQDQTFNVDFKDFKLNDNGTAEGTFTLNVKAICTLTLALSANGDTQTLKLGCSALGKEYGSVSIEYSAKEATDFSYPNISADQVTKFTDSKTVAEYLKNSKFETFIKTIIDTFNLPTTEDAKTLANAIVSELEAGETINFDEFLNESTPGSTPDTSQNNGSETITNGTYKPEDYNLPADTEIDEYGYYNYELSDAEVADLKKKQSDYKTFDKTYDQFKSFTETLVRTYCGADAMQDTFTTNNVSGNIDNSYKSITHQTCHMWFSSSTSNSFEVITDSLNDKILSVNLSVFDGSTLPSAIKEIHSQLGIAAVPDKTLKEIETLIANKKEITNNYTLADSTLCLRIGTSPNETEYSVSIVRDDTIY
ncbi:MAG: hypothetical protein Q4F05_08640 [bacterium]|nr:hypothetical protein [bacterium]